LGERAAAIYSRPLFLNSILFKPTSFMSQDDMFIDKIRYGNPSKEEYNNMQVRNFLTIALEEDLKQFPFPKNSTHVVKQELQMLLDYQDSDTVEMRKQIFDVGMIPEIVNICAANGKDAGEVDKICKQVTNDVLPLITKLKYYYNRPRPYQLAYYFHFKLFPYFSKFVSSPCYPSGHATLGAVICEVLGSRYRGAYAGMKELTGMIAESRLYMGVHYVSDNNFALQVAERICTNKDFRKKYEFDIYLD
jgi:hypothetical protein